MRRSEAFPSQYLGKDDVQQDILAHIKDVGKESIKSDGADEEKAVMTWQERDLKPMILNNTNWMALEDAYGEESDGWKGKPVEIYLDPSVMYGGKRVGGVRLRVPKPTATAPAQTNGSGAQSIVCKIKNANQGATNSSGVTVWMVNTDHGEFGTTDKGIGEAIIGHFIGQYMRIDWKPTQRGGRMIVKAVRATEQEAANAPIAEDDIPF